MNETVASFELLVEGPARRFAAAEPLQPSKFVCLSTQDQRRDKRLRITDELDDLPESSTGRVSSHDTGKSVGGGVDPCEVSKQLKEIKEILTMVLQCLAVARGADHEDHCV